MIFPAFSLKLTIDDDPSFNGKQSQRSNCVSSFVTTQVDSAQCQLIANIIVLTLGKVQVPCQTNLIFAESILQHTCSQHLFMLFNFS